MSKSEPPAQNKVSDGANNSNENNVKRPHFPSSATTKRERTYSARSFETPTQTGKIKVFCRTQGHGFITSDNSGEDIFVHVSDIEGEYVPLPGDEVEYRLCPIPPKLDKSQAVHVRITNLTAEVHPRWSS